MKRDESDLEYYNRVHELYIGAIKMLIFILLSFIVPALLGIIIGYYD